MSLAIVRVEGFKELSVRYGRAAAEAVSRRVYCALNWAITRSRDLLFRTDQADFAVVFPHTGARGARLIVDRMQALIAALEPPAGMGESIAASIGVSSAIATADGTPDDLVVTAQTALHQANRTSRAHE